MTKNNCNKIKHKKNEGFEYEIFYGDEPGQSAVFD